VQRTAAALQRARALDRATPFPTTLRGPVYRVPPLTTVQSQFGFASTRNRGVRWRTTFDFCRGAFAANVFSRERALHVGRANLRLRRRRPLPG
jgi:hypothetical protein